MQVNESSAGHVESVSLGASDPQLPPIWGVIAQRISREMTVPRGLLLRAMPTPATLAQLVADVRAGASPSQLAMVAGLAPDHGLLVHAAVLQTTRSARRPRTDSSLDPALIARLRLEIEEGHSIEAIVTSHGFTPGQRLRYLIQSGLTAYAADKRHQARRDIPVLVAQGREVPDALLCMAIGIPRPTLHEIHRALHGGKGLLQVMQHHRLPWPDARLIAQAIHWKPSWRKREQRVGRLSLEEVLRRAANNENPVWIAEAAGVRAQWIRQVLKREGLRRTAGAPGQRGTGRHAVR